MAEEHEKVELSEQTIIDTQAVIHASLMYMVRLQPNKKLTLTGDQLLQITPEHQMLFNHDPVSNTFTFEVIDPHVSG
jgi:hypothetical protein